MAYEEFQKKHKEVQPVVAICYDFDKTRSEEHTSELQSH